MRVEMLPAEVTALEGAPAAAVDPTGPLVLVNPTCDVDRLIAYVTPLLPDVDPVVVSAALRATLRAYEVEALEVDYAISAAGHPCEVTAPILLPVAAGSGGIGWLDDQLDTTQPVAKVVDPGITADDVPPYPPGRIRAPYRPTPSWMVLFAGLGLLAFAGFLLGGGVPTVSSPPPGQTDPPTPAPPTMIEGTRIVDQTSPVGPQSSPSTSVTPTVPPTPSASAPAGLPVPSPPGDLTTPPTSAPTPAPTAPSASLDPGTDPVPVPVPDPGIDPGGTVIDPGAGGPTVDPTIDPPTDPTTDPGGQILDP